MTIQEDLQKDINELEATLQEPALTAPARKRIQTQIDATKSLLLSVSGSADVQSLSLDEQIAQKEQEIAALRAQLPGYETHPDEWDSQGRLVSNVLTQK